MQKDEESPAVLNWVAPGAAVSLAGWEMVCSVKLSCTMSFKLVVKGVTSLWWQPGRTELWGTLVNFLILVKFKIPLETTLFFLNGIFYLESK